MSAFVLVQAAEADGFGGRGVVAAAFGDVQVTTSLRAAVTAARMVARLAGGQSRYGQAMNPAPMPYDWVQPVTITPDRYGGLYSGGAWLAFPPTTSKVPEGPFSGDVFAETWWGQLGDVPVGRGDSPDQAYDDLVRRLEVIGPTRIRKSSELSGTWW